MGDSAGSTLSVDSADGQMGSGGLSGQCRFVVDGDFGWDGPVLDGLGLSEILWGGFDSLGWSLGDVESRGGRWVLFVFSLRRGDFFGESMSLMHALS